MLWRQNLKNIAKAGLELMILLLQPLEQLGLQALATRPRWKLGFERRVVITTVETVRDANQRKQVSKEEDVT